MSERLTSLSRAPTANMNHPPTPHPMFSTNGKCPYQEVDSESKNHDNRQHDVKRRKSCLSQVSFGGDSDVSYFTEKPCFSQISRPAISGQKLLRYIRNTFNWSEIVEQSSSRMKPSEFRDFICWKLQGVLEREIILPHVGYPHLSHLKRNGEETMKISVEDGISDYEASDSEFEDDFTSDVDDDQSEFDLLEDDDFDGDYESESDN